MNDRMKSAITQELTCLTCLKLKGQDAIIVQDKCNFVFTTNNAWPVKREADDRRYSCQECSGVKVGDKKYFDELLEELGDPQTAFHFHQYLSSIDISDWDPKKMPITTWGEELKDHSIPSHVQMVQALLENGCFHPDLETWVASVDIKRTYDTFCAQMDIKEDRHIDVNVLMRSLKGVFHMRAQARTIQGKRTHKGWWFPPQSAVCKALHDGKLLSSTVKSVDTWQRIEYDEDKEGPWIAAAKSGDDLKDPQKLDVDAPCSCCGNNHGWRVRRDNEGHIETRKGTEDGSSDA
jgi:hypothetical protein